MKSKYFEITEDSNGDEIIHSPDEALMVPLASDGQVIFIREPAPAFDGESALLLPGGTVESGEDALITANRELQEEIGYRASRLEPLVEMRPWSKYLRVTSIVFLARDLIPSKLDGDETHTILLEPHPLASLDDLIATGALRDARVIAALLLARQRLARG